MLTAQSCARHGSGGSAEAPSPAGARSLAGMGCTAFQGCEGHLTISPIPARLGWHHWQLSELCLHQRATDTGSAALDLLRGGRSAGRGCRAKNSIRLQVCRMQTLPVGGEFMKTHSPPNAPSAPNLWDKTPCSLPSPKQTQLETGLGGEWMGRGGTSSPACSIFRSMAPFIHPYADLSMCSPTCHMWLQKLF